MAARAPGRALDVACGRGRNALALAELGFDVDAVDVSDVAVAAVAELAAERGLTVTAARVDLADAPPLPCAPYDVIVDVHFLERRLLPRLAAALAPGGVLVFEGFRIERRGMRESYLLRPNELLRTFSDLHVVDYREGRAAQLVARRPA